MDRMVGRLVVAGVALAALLVLGWVPANAEGEATAGTVVPHWAGKQGRPGSEVWAAQAKLDAGITPEWLPGHVFGLVDEGLGAMGMARPDLDFTKRVAGPQEHLLEPVRRTLDESLSVPMVADGLVERDDPWVALGLMEPTRALAVRQWCEGLTYGRLVEAVCGRAPSEDDNLRTALKWHLADRGFGEFSYSYLVDFVNRGEMGAELEESSFTGSSAELPAIMMVAVAVIHDLSDVFSGGKPERVTEEAVLALGHLMDDGINSVKVAPGSVTKASLSSHVGRVREAIMAGRKVVPARPVGFPRTAAEACVAWPVVSRVLAETIRDEFNRVRSDYVAKHPSAPRNAGELVQSGLDVIAYARKGDQAGANAWNTRIVVGGFGNDRHAPTEAVVMGGLNGRNGPASLLVDVGGADRYPLMCAVAVSGRCVAVHDFGDESDTYGGGLMAAKREPRASEAWELMLGPCAAIGGCAVLEDYGGDDVYAGGDVSLAAAAGGAAYLRDHGGSDVYRGGQFTQAAALAGYAELVDIGQTPGLGVDAPRGEAHGEANSNDSYSCARYGQGFGFVLGVGRLEDTGGNDRYYAGGVYRHMPLWNDRYQTLSQGMGFGWRGENIAGGIGLLIDRGEGNDSYEADIYGQGSSYWYALGVCWDEGGNDHYRLGHYGQGAGIHLSTGILVDKGGHDTYTNFYGVGCGGAHDYAVGWLVDLKGDDCYYANGLAQALNNSSSVFYDGGGDDCYSSRADSAIGCGVNNSVALLIDEGGFDRYTIPVTNGLWHVRGEYGIVMDVDGPADKVTELAAGRVWRNDLVAREALAEAARKAAELAAAGSGPGNTAAAAGAGAEPVPGSAGRKPVPGELDSLWEKACEWEVGTPENIAKIREARVKLVELGALEFLMGQLHHTYPLQLRALWGTVPHFGAAAVDGLFGAAERAHSRLRGDQSGRSAGDVANDVGIRRNGVDLLARLKAADVPAALKAECLELTDGVGDERERIRLLTSLARWEELHAGLRGRFAELLGSKQDIVRKLAVEGLAPLMKNDEAWTVELATTVCSVALSDPYFAVRWSCLKMWQARLAGPNEGGLVPSMDSHREADPVRLMLLVHGMAGKMRAAEGEATPTEAQRNHERIAAAAAAVMTWKAIATDVSKASDPMEMKPAAALFLARHTRMVMDRYVAAIGGTALAQVGEVRDSVGKVLKRQSHPAVVGALMQLAGELDATMERDGDPLAGK